MKHLVKIHIIIYLKMLMYTKMEDYERFWLKSIAFQINICYYSIKISQNISNSVNRR